MILEIELLDDAECDPLGLENFHLAIDAAGLEAQTARIIRVRYRTDLGRIEQDVNGGSVLRNRCDDVNARYNEAGSQTTD